MAKKKSGKKKKSSSIQQTVFQLFQSNPTQVFNYKQVSKRLGITQTSKRKIIAKVLFELAAKDLIEEQSPGRFKIIGTTDNLHHLVGKVDMTSSGAAYIEIEGHGNDIYVGERDLGTALHGDLVEIGIIKTKKNGQAVGKVLRVVERAKTEFVGTISKSLKYAFLIPDSRNMPVDIFIPLANLNGAQNGEKVIVKMLGWNDGEDSPTGEVIQVLGMPGNNETEMHAILAEFGLPAAFPKAIEEEAKNLDLEIKADEIKKRKDFRKITTFTIDPTDAKDFDDALSVRQLKNGNTEVGVHIADVSHYLKEGSNLDKEAYDRATSVYLVDRVVPMLPEVLSNFACSLRPNEDKYCFSAVFELDDQAQIIKEWFGRTVIHSDRRFTYAEAQEVIETGEGDYAQEILQLQSLAIQLRKERFKAGSIDFHAVEVKFELSDDGEPIGVFVKQQKEANKLIEDFMLLANKRVAQFIATQSKVKPFVYRIHESPDPEKLATFGNFIKKFGYRIDTSSPKGVSASLNKLMTAVEGKAEEPLISQLAIRTMSKAIYSTDNVGHYGLGFKYYSHFTSPIRRYPDVMVHRLLQHYLDGGEAANAESLEEKCKHSSEREKLATDAERASIKFMQVKFLQDKIGEVFGGVISGVSEYGLFVELEGNKCEGMVRLRNLTDDFYVFDPDNYCAVGKRYGKMYRMGDEVTIRVKKADLAKKQLDFEMLSDYDFD